jgi:hypothetical protein
MRKLFVSRFIGVLLALLAVSAMTSLQVDYANAAVQAQTTQVRIILSQPQLADLAKRDHGLYAQVIKAYRGGAPLFVTRHQYQVLSHLSTAYLGTARAGQPAPGAPGSATNPISVGKTPSLPVPASGHSGAGAIGHGPRRRIGIVPAIGRGFGSCARHRARADHHQRDLDAALAVNRAREVIKGTGRSAKDAVRAEHSPGRLVPSNVGWEGVTKSVPGTRGR